MGWTCLVLQEISEKEKTKVSWKNTFVPGSPVHVIGSSDEPETPAASTSSFVPQSPVPHLTLGELDLYIFLLKSQGMLLPLCEDFYAVQDIKNRKLVLHHFQLLRRRVITVSGEALCVWSCSCDAFRQSFVDLLPSTVEKFDQDLYNECLHIGAVNVLVRTADHMTKDVEEDHQAYARRLPGEGKVLFQQVPHHFATTAVFQADTGLGIVSVTYPLPKQEATLCCYNCSKHRHTCRHVQLVEENLREDPLLDELRMYMELEVEVPTYTQYIPVAVNNASFPFFKDSDYSTNIGDYCSCGYRWDVRHCGADIPVFSKDHVYSTELLAATCRSCEMEASGLITNSPVLFMTNYGIALDVMWDYVKSFCTAGISMFEYYKMWLWDLWIVTHDPEISTKMTYGRFRFAVLSFMHHLDINVQQGYLCPECGNQPKIVVFDGMTLAFRKQLQLCERPDESSSRKYDGSQHTARVFINNQETRKLLFDFADAGIQEKDLTRLLNLCKLYQPSLVDLIQHCIDSGIEQPPPVMQDLLKDLSKNVPVAAILPPLDDVTQLAEEIILGRQLDVAELATLHSKCPFIAEVLVQGRIPEPSFANILREMLRISREPFKVAEPLHRKPLQEDELGCYPNLPQLCQRGQYILDAKPLLKEPNCEKRKPRHPSLLPGIFSLLCPHGVCYGFDIMESAESPNCAFTCLRTRFQQGPDVVIYDNSCHLHSYALNRCTTFFEKTKFVVDRLHWYNHTGCSRAYNIGAYPIYSHINSQVAEQRHAQLTKLKSMLSYMDSRNFKKFLSVYTWFHNCLKIAKLFPEHDLQYRSKFEVLTLIFQRM